MRIGMLTACYTPVLNGVTRSVMLYKRHLEQRGHDVTVFTLGRDTTISDDGDVVRTRGVPLGQTGYFAAPRLAATARRRLAEMDIVHCHHLYMSLEFGRKYAAPNTPVVYTNHTRYDLYTSELFHLPQAASDWYHRWFWPRRASLADAVIAPSAELRDLMVAFGIDAPIHVIENGIDVATYAQPEQPYDRRVWGFDDSNVVALYVGRLSAEKRADDLLRQTAMAMTRAPLLRLVLVGPGPDRGRLERMAHRLGIADRVYCAGPVAFDEVPGYLAAADFFVTASRSEVHPLTVIEALAAGLPVVAYDSEGIRATVEHARTGLLACDGKLGDALVELATNRPRRSALSAAARSSAIRYGFSLTCDRTLALYDELLSVERSLYST